MILMVIVIIMVAVVVDLDMFSKVVMVVKEAAVEVMLVVILLHLQEVLKGEERQEMLDKMEDMTTPQQKVETTPMVQAEMLVKVVQILAVVEEDVGLPPLLHLSLQESITLQMLEGAVLVLLLYVIPASKFNN